MRGNFIPLSLAIICFSLPVFGQTSRRAEFGAFGGLTFGLPGSQINGGTEDVSTKSPLAYGGAEVGVNVLPWLQIYGDFGYISLGNAQSKGCAPDLAVTPGLVFPSAQCPQLMQVNISASAITFHAGVEFSSRKREGIVPFARAGWGFYDQRGNGETRITSTTTNQFGTPTPLQLDGLGLHPSGQFGGGMKMYFNDKFGLKAGLDLYVVPAITSNSGTFVGARAGIFFEIP
jgi:hypothetical protein